MKRKYERPRRDLVWLVGKRAGKLKANQSEAAWLILARKLEALGDKDIPKFLDLLVAIRVATIMAKRLTKS